MQFGGYDLVGAHKSALTMSSEYILGMRVFWEGGVEFNSKPIQNNLPLLEISD
jgi:hypothetical protein